MEDLFKSEWEFVKLFVGLNAATFGGWYLAQDRVITSNIMGLLFALVLFLLGLSLIRSLSAVLKMATVLQLMSLRVASELPGDTPQKRGEEVMDELKPYKERISRAFDLFMIGGALAGLTLVFNIVHKHLPWK